MSNVVAAYVVGGLIMSAAVGTMTTPAWGFFGAGATLVSVSIVIAMSRYNK